MSLNAVTFKNVHRFSECKKRKTRHGVASGIDQNLPAVVFYQKEQKSNRHLDAFGSILKHHALRKLGFSVLKGR